MVNALFVYDTSIYCCLAMIIVSRRKAIFASVGLVCTTYCTRMIAVLCSVVKGPVIQVHSEMQTTVATNGGIATPCAKVLRVEV